MNKRDYFPFGPKLFACGLDELLEHCQSAPFDKVDSRDDKAFGCGAKHEVVGYGDSRGFV